MLDFMRTADWAHPPVPNSQEPVLSHFCFAERCASRAPLRSCFACVYHSFCCAITLCPWPWLAPRWPSLDSTFSLLYSAPPGNWNHFQCSVSSAPSPQGCSLLGPAALVLTWWSGRVACESGDAVDYYLGCGSRWPACVSGGGEWN